MSNGPELFALRQMAHLWRRLSAKFALFAKGQVAPAQPKSACLTLPPFLGSRASRPHAVAGRQRKLTFLKEVKEPLLSGIPK